MPLMQVTQANLDTLLKETPKLVINIGADWCKDCRHAAPFYRQFAEKMADKALFTECDCEPFPEVRERFQVKHIPTMIVFENGRELGRIVEVQTPSALRDFLVEHLGA